MTQKIYFDDGSILEITISKPEKGTMAMIAYRKLTDYVEEDLLDDPKLKLLEETVAVEEEEDLGDLSLDEEDLEDLDEFEDDDWVDDEELDDDWLDEEEEEAFDDEWVMDR